MSSFYCSIACQATKFFLNFGNKKFQRVFIEDTKAMGRVLIMFLPVPIFWSLYDQQGSIWLIQGVQMDCTLWGNTLLLPDQMQTLNAVLILAFIPIFQIIIYPMVGKVIKLT
jgi:solute carrier family 15 oligopeptide transporter 1